MKTSVIGFPRIGTLRELKFASEKYFRKEIDGNELTQTAEELRKTHWKLQKKSDESQKFIDQNRQMVSAFVISPFTIWF